MFLPHGCPPTHTHLHRSAATNPISPGYAIKPSNPSVITVLGMVNTVYLTKGGCSAVLCGERGRGGAPTAARERWVMRVLMNARPTTTHARTRTHA